MTWEDNEGLFLCLKLCLVPDWGQYQDITLQMLICVMVKLSSAKFRPHPGFWLRDEKLHATYSEKRRGKKWGSTGDPSKLKRHPRTPVLLLFQHSFPVKHLRVYNAASADTWTHPRCWPKAWEDSWLQNWLEWSQFLWSHKPIMIIVLAHTYKSLSTDCVQSESHLFCIISLETGCYLLY